jgi:hypothetical protein
MNEFHSKNGLERALRGSLAAAIIQHAAFTPVIDSVCRQRILFIEADVKSPCFVHRADVKVPDLFNEQTSEALFSSSSRRKSPCSVHRADVKEGYCFVCRADVKAPVLFIEQTSGLKFTSFLYTIIPSL